MLLYRTERVLGLVPSFVCANSERQYEALLELVLAGDPTLNQEKVPSDGSPLGLQLSTQNVLLDRVTKTPEVC